MEGPKEYRLTIREIKDKDIVFSEEDKSCHKVPITECNALGLFCTTAKQKTYSFLDDHCSYIQRRNGLYSTVNSTSNALILSPRRQNSLCI